MKEEAGWPSGEKLAENTHWRHEGRSDFHRTSHRQNTLCLLHTNWTRTQTDTDTDRQRHVKEDQTVMLFECENAIKKG